AGATTGTGPIIALQSGDCPALDGHAPSLPPRGARSPGVRRGSASTGNGARVWALGRLGNNTTGLGPDVEGADSEGWRPNVQRRDGLASSRGRRYRADIPGRACRGLWKIRAEGGSAGSADGSTSTSGSQGRALLGGRDLSAQRRVAPSIRHPRYARGSNLLSSGPQHCPPPAGQIPRVAGRHVLRSAVAGLGQARRSPPAASRGVRLVHGGV